MGDDLEDDLLALLSDEGEGEGEGEGEVKREMKREEGVDIDLERREQQQGRAVRLQRLGDDAQMRVISYLPVAKLCMLAQVCTWAKELGSRDCTWRLLYLERWPDALGQTRDKTARSRGWKEVKIPRLSCRPARALPHAVFDLPRPHVLD